MIFSFTWYIITISTVDPVRLFHSRGGMLLFGPVTLLCGLKWDISLLFDEWWICLVVRLWTPSTRLTPVPRCWLFHSHRRHLPCVQRWNKLSLHSALLLSRWWWGGLLPHVSLPWKAVLMGLMINSRICNIYLLYFKYTIRMNTSNSHFVFRALILVQRKVALLLCLIVFW